MSIVIVCSSLANRPMLHDDPGKGEVPGVPGGDPPADADRGRGDQRVRLKHRPAPSCERATPVPRESTLGDTERGKAETLEEFDERIVFDRTQPPCHLFDADGAHVRPITRSFQAGQASRRAGTTAEVVDHDRRVEDDRAHSADCARVGATLSPNPGGRILVPIVAVIGDAAGGPLDGPPSLLLLDGLPHRVGYEWAPAAGPDEVIYPPHEVLVEVDVHSHVRTIAHT
jgi:hypothetical protein